MIQPFQPEAIKEGVISFGVGHYSYDMRVSDEFKVFTNVFNTVVDPKNFDPRAFVDVRGSYVDIPPNSFALGRSVEYFRMPSNMLALCLGKSTYARCGIITNFTPFEPGWKGFVTIEISNTTPLPARVYANEGIGAVIFFENDEEPESTYTGKKYDGQEGITLAKV